MCPINKTACVMKEEDKAEGVRDKRFTDMTCGDSTRAIFLFSLPLLFGNLFQQMYSLTDSAIIGQYVGIHALAAIGAGAWLIWLLNALCRDCSNAFCIAASLRVGSGDTAGFRKITTHAVLLGIAICLGSILFMLLSLDRLMHLLNVPNEIYSMAKTYLAIAILTLPFSLTFHLIASLLRATGNSRITFQAMAISTTVNIVLDILVVLAFRWGVAGTAIATMIAQGFSALVVFWRAKESGLFCFEKQDWKFSAVLLWEIIKIWLPLGLNSLVLMAGGSYVSSKVNSVGTYFAAGCTTNTHIFTIFESVIMAIQTGVSVFVGQNLGANQPQRIRTGITKAVKAAMLVTVGIILVCWSFDNELVSLFLSSKDTGLYESASSVGITFLHFQITGMLIMTPMYLYRITLQTLGHPNYAVIAAILQMIVRILTVQFLPAFIGVNAYYLPTVIAWMVSLPIVFVPYRVHIRRLCTGTAN